MNCFFFSVSRVRQKKWAVFLAKCEKVKDIFFCHHSGITVKLARVCYSLSIVCRFPFPVIQAWNINKRNYLRSRNFSVFSVSRVRQKWAVFLVECEKREHFLLPSFRDNLKISTSLPFILNCLSVCFSRNSSVEHKQKNLFVMTQLVCFFYLSGSPKVSSFPCRVRKRKTFSFTVITLKLARVCHSFSIVSVSFSRIWSVEHKQKNLFAITQLVFFFYFSGLPIKSSFSCQVWKSKGHFLLPSFGGNL